MTILLRFWREIFILIMVLVFFYLYNNPIEVIKELPRIVEVEKVVTKTVVKTVITKPDGTTIVKEEQKDSTEDKTSDKVVTPIVKLNPYKYSIGVSIRDLDYKDFLVDAGIRLATTPLVATVGFDVKPRSFLLGVRYEF